MLHCSKATKRGSLKKGACLHGRWEVRTAETSGAADDARRAPGNATGVGIERIKELTDSHGFNFADHAAAPSRGRNVAVIFWAAVRLPGRDFDPAHRTIFCLARREPSAKVRSLAQVVGQTTSRGDEQDSHPNRIILGRSFATASDDRLARQTSPPVSAGVGYGIHSLEQLPPRLSPRG